MTMSKSGTQTRMPYAVQAALVEAAGKLFWYWAAYEHFLRTAGVSESAVERLTRDRPGKYEVMRHLLRDLDKAGHRGQQVQRLHQRRDQPHRPLLLAQRKRASRPPFRAKEDHRLVRRQARPDVKAGRDADHRSRGNPIARRLGVGTIAASPIWRSACQGVGVVVHCLVGGSCCGRRLAGRSAGSRRWSCSYSPGWVPQDLCSSHVRRLKLADR